MTKTLTDLEATRTLRCCGCSTAVDHPNQQHKYMSSMGPAPKLRLCSGQYGFNVLTDFDAWHAAVAHDDYGDRPWFDWWSMGSTRNGVKA